MLARPFKLALPVLVAALSIASAPQVHAQDKVLKVGTLKLIHGISAYFYEKFVPAGYTVEVIPFESPTDGKNAVLTGTVDTCIHGIAAFLLGAAAGEHRDQIDRLGDQRPRHRDHRFLDQLLEPAQCSERGARMDGADATRMSGAPGFEQVESLSTAHFPDWNAIRSKTQR